MRTTVWVWLLVLLRLWDWDAPWDPRDDVPDVALDGRASKVPAHVVRLVRQKQARTHLVCLGVTQPNALGQQAQRLVAHVAVELFSI